MYYKGGRGVVPPAGVCPGKMIVKYAGRLLKANCAAQPKGCSACFVPQTHYEMQINRDFTLSRFYVEMCS